MKGEYNEKNEPFENCDSEEMIYIYISPVKPKELKNIYILSLK